MVTPEGCREIKSVLVDRLYFHIPALTAKMTLAVIGLFTRVSRSIIWVFFFVLFVNDILNLDSRLDSRFLCVAPDPRLSSYGKVIEVYAKKTVAWNSSLSVVLDHHCHLLDAVLAILLGPVGKKGGVPASPKASLKS
ncbi:hypothetical protein VTN77DRAFT_8272 [Rasamsonia byssochlamydoides]|uniref:uncharacterized protein n=1 Tax=Rasamsonia byssochlamydoides TaxID=89139 RepID=UPI0037441E0D